MPSLPENHQSSESLRGKVLSARRIVELPSQRPHQPDRAVPSELRHRRRNPRSSGKTPDGNQSPRPRLQPTGFGRQRPQEVVQAAGATGKIAETQFESLQVGILRGQLLQFVVDRARHQLESYGRRGGGEPPAEAAFDPEALEHAQYRVEAAKCHRQDFLLEPK